MRERRLMRQSVQRSCLPCVSAHRRLERATGRAKNVDMNSAPNAVKTKSVIGLLLAASIGGCGESSERPRPDAEPPVRSSPSPTQTMPPPTSPTPVEVADDADVITTPMQAEQEFDPLAVIPREDRASIVALRRWLEGTDSKKRIGALAALAKIGAGAKEVAPAVEKALADPHAEIRIGAATSLWRITGNADASVAALVDVLRRGSATARIASALALGGLGAAAKGAVAALAETLEEVEPPRTAGALRMNGDVVEDAYIDMTPASAAADALGEIGPEAKVALPALRRVASSDKEEVLRASAREAVRMIEAKAK